MISEIDRFRHRRSSICDLRRRRRRQELRARVAGPPEPDPTNGPRRGFAAAGKVDLARGYDSAALSRAADRVRASQHRSRAVVSGAARPSSRSASRPQEGQRHQRQRGHARSRPCRERERRAARGHHQGRGQPVGAGSVRRGPTRRGRAGRRASVTLERGGREAAGAGAGAGDPRAGQGALDDAPSIGRRRPTRCPPQTTARATSATSRGAGTSASHDQAGGPARPPWRSAPTRQVGGAESSASPPRRA